MDQRLVQPVADQGRRQAGRMVPALNPCEMPEQILWPDGSTNSSTKTRVRGARLALVLLWALATAAFAWTLYAVLSVEDPTYLQLAFWLLSTVCFAWVAMGSASALIGFISLFMFRNADTIELPPAGLDLARADGPSVSRLSRGSDRGRCHDRHHVSGTRGSKCM